MEKSLHTDDWPSLLPNAVMQLNSRPLKRLNGLAPKDFMSQWDDYKIDGTPQPRASTSQLQSGPQLKPDLKQQQANQRAYEANSKVFQVGDHVYVDNKPKTFAKSFQDKASYTPNFFQSSQTYSVLQKSV